MWAISGGVCALKHIAINLLFLTNFMLAIRLYLSALTLTFLFVVLAFRGLGVLEAIVITCAVIYLILDVRTDLQFSKSELELLKELEKRLSPLLR